MSEFRRFFEGGYLPSYPDADFQQPGNTFPGLWNYDGIGKLQHSGTDPSAVGDGIKNSSGAHDIIMRSGLTASPIDFLNGADVGVEYDSDGVPMVVYTDRSKPDFYGNYTTGSPAAGPINFTTVTDPSVAITGTGITSVLSFAPTTNFLAWICVNDPGGNDHSFNGAMDKIGFDLGGANYEGNPSSTLTEGISVGLGKVRNLESWNGTARVENSATWFRGGAISGRLCTVVGFNGVSSLVGAATINSGATVTAPTLTTTDMTTATHTGLGSSGEPMTMNFGEGTTGVGVYSMGIRNVANAITQADVERVCQYMGKTGLLPYWWR